MKTPVSFKHPHYVEIATVHGQVSKSDAEKFVCTWFGIGNLEQVATRMQFACQEVIKIIRPHLTIKPDANPYEFITTQIFDNLLKTAVAEADQWAIKGWLLCPERKLATKAAQKAFRNARNSRIRAFAKKNDIYNYEDSEFRDLVEFSVETEIKRFSMIECHLPGFTLQNYQAEDVATFEADFSSLIAWTRDSRSWSIYKKTVALDIGTDALKAYQYLAALPHIIQMTVLHYPGVFNYSSGHIKQIMENAGKNITEYREEVAKVGLDAANNSSEFRHTQYDIDRIKADYDSLQKWAEDWVNWSASMGQEASKNGLGVLTKFAHLKDLPMDVAVTYLRGSGGMCGAGYAEHYFTEAEKQINAYLSETNSTVTSQQDERTNPQIQVS